MVWLLRVAMLLGYCAATSLLVLAIADLVARRWKRGFAELGIAVVAIFGGTILVGVSASVIAASSYDGALTPPAEKARILADIISDATNWSRVGAFVGVIAGGYLAVTRRRIEGGA